MTNPAWRYAAVHLGFTEISVVATGGAFEGPRESVGAAFASVQGGSLAFGRDMAGVEIPPLLCIDDTSIPVGTSVWDREAVLHGIVWSALQNAGVRDRLDVLEIAYPSTWGEERSGILRTTFAASASEVVLVETAEAAISWSGERAPGAAVVVEVGALDTSVVVLDESGAHGGDTGAVLPFGIDDSAWRRAVGEYVGSAVARCPDEVYVVSASSAGPDPIVDHHTHWLTGLDVARSLYRRAGADLVPAPSVRAATTRSAAWLDDVAASPSQSGKNRRAYLITIACAVSVVVVSVCLAAYFTGGSPAAVDDSAAQPFSPMVAPTVSLPSVLEPEPTTVPVTPIPVETVTFVYGRASLRLPVTWTKSEDTDRMVLIPSTPPERRIVVTVAELNPGSTQEQVAAELRSAVDARGPDSSIGSLEPTRDFGGRVGIAYIERPVDGSTVLWRVFVQSDLQVSIGCQFEGDDSAVIDTECGQATQSLDIVPAS